MRFSLKQKDKSEHQYSKEQLLISFDNDEFQKQRDAPNEINYQTR
jgi:hypothetical protein